MKQTESLNLKKPEATDLYNIEDQNANADILDGAIGNLPDLTTIAKDNLVAAINEVSSATVPADRITDTQSRQMINTITTEGTGEAYTATLPGLTEYYKGLTVLICPHTSSTVGVPTLNINGLGDVQLRQLDGYLGGIVANPVNARWLSVSRCYILIYDGGRFVVANSVPLGTRSNFGTVKMAGNGIANSTSDRVYPSYAPNPNVTDLNDMAFTYEGRYHIMFLGNAIGLPPGLEPATAYRATIDTASYSIAGSANTTQGIKQTLVIAKLGRTWERYGYMNDTTYGEWVEVGGANITATENKTKHTLLICDSAQLIDDTVTDTIVIGRDAGGGGNNTVVIGSLAGSDDGGATVIGQGAYALEAGGIAVGHNAKADKAYAIQLGEGINNNPNTFQVCNYQLLDAEGNIPAERLKNAVPEVIDLGDTTADITELLTDERINALIPSVPEQVIEYQIKYLYYGEEPVIGRLYAGMCSANTSRPSMWYQVYIPITDTANPRTLVRSANDDLGTVQWDEWTDFTPKQPRTATVIVASTTSTDAAKAGADYVVANDANLAANIQAAINRLPPTGGEVHFCAGEYNFDACSAAATAGSAIKITLKSHTKVSGEGGATLFSKNDTNAAITMFFSEGENISISDIRFWADSAATPIHLRSARDVNIERVTIKGNGNSDRIILCQSCNGVNIDHVQITLYDNDIAIKLSKCYSSSVTNCIFAGSSGATYIMIYGGTTRTKVIGNTFTDINDGGKGITINGDTSAITQVVMITDNIFKANGGGDPYTIGVDAGMNIQNVCVYNNVFEVSSEARAITGKEDLYLNMDGGSGDWNRVISS